MSLSRPSDFVIDIDNVEHWLYEFDRQPRVIPRWPGRRMALVACIVEDMGTAQERHPEAYVLVAPEQADALCDFTNSLDHMGVLFFSVPRRTLIDSELVEGLTEASWD